ncbi:unnamed protein product, partial [Adineta ricciae]
AYLDACESILTAIESHSTQHQAYVATIRQNLLQALSSIVH